MAYFMDIGGVLTGFENIYIYPREKVFGNIFMSTLLLLYVSKLLLVEP